MRKGMPPETMEERPCITARSTGALECCNTGNKRFQDLDAGKRAARMVKASTPRTVALYVPSVTVFHSPSALLTTNACRHQIVWTVPQGCWMKYSRVEIQWVPSATTSQPLWRPVDLVQKSVSKRCIFTIIIFSAFRRHGSTAGEPLPRQNIGNAIRQRAWLGVMTGSNNVLKYTSYSSFHRALAGHQLVCSTSPVQSPTPSTCVLPQQQICLDLQHGTFACNCKPGRMRGWKGPGTPQDD